VKTFSGSENPMIYLMENYVDHGILIKLPEGKMYDISQRKVNRKEIATVEVFDHYEVKLEQR
jgi:hypothetical protein